MKYPTDFNPRFVQQFSIHHASQASDDIKSNVDKILQALVGKLEK